MDTPAALTPQPAPSAPQAAAPAEDAATAVVSLYVKQQKIYARAVDGRFAFWRRALVWATQLVFYGLPWLMWNGRQAVLFDLGARRFYIFGLVLYPQDFIYLSALLVVSAYSLFLFTAVAGRLWCGFACPQTVYTEIFMAIERFFQGDRIARMRRDKGPLTLDKAWRASAKHATWLLLALWTGLSFVGYFTPLRSLLQEAAQLGFGPWEWFWVLFYALATYGNAGFLREQVCKYMCPYARFQSAMFDKDTLIVSYDGARGEARGSRPRKADPKALGLGDCIDCGLCVDVCPTGIDIRKGLQYECIGCASCVDVCDGVMDKMGYPRGLVRFATQNSMAGGWGRAQIWQRVLRPRVLVYSGILLAIIVALGWSLASRSSFRVDVVRDRASLARQVDNGQVENIYRLQLMNASEAPQRFRLSVAGMPGMRLVEADPLRLQGAEARWFTVAVRLDAQEAQRAGAGAHAMQFEVERLEPDPNATVQRAVEKSTFIVPQ